MKYVLGVFAVLVLFLAACSPTEVATASNTVDDMDHDKMDGMNHELTDTMGCGEGQIIDGVCVFEEEPLAEVFVETFGEVTNDIRSEDIDLGYLVRPDDEEVYPGVILIHEWWGLNDNIKQMANILANEGYTVLAVDLYDGVVSDDPNVARAMVGKVRQEPEAALATMQEAASYLRSEYNVESMASMGWCFGGGQSLNLATSGEDLDATVIYYGTLTDDTQLLGNIDQPVLGIFGQNDTSIPLDTVESFENALNEVGIQNNIHVYDGVGHAFANPSGDRFGQDEAMDAWLKTVEFLNANLK